MTIFINTLHILKRGYLFPNSLQKSPLSKTVTSSFSTLNIPINQQKQHNIPIYFKDTLKNYLLLSKSKLSLFVSISTIPGFLLSTYALNLPLFTSLVTIGSPLLIGSFLQSASANSMNQIIEHSQDGMMKRTCFRPIPSGKLSINHSIGFSLVSGGIGTLLLWSYVSPNSALIGLSTWALYVAIYTPLKKVHPINTGVGSIAGSLPVLMGFTLCQLTPVAPLVQSQALLFFLSMTAWQFPHFYSLAWLYRNDYIKGGYRMLSEDDDNCSKTLSACAKWIGGPLCVLPIIFTIGLPTVHWSYLPLMTIGNISYWYFGFLPFAKDPKQLSNCRIFFKYSLIYLIWMFITFSITGMIELERERNLINSYYEIDNNNEKWTQWARIFSEMLNSSNFCIHRDLENLNKQFKLPCFVHVLFGRKKEE